MKKTIILKIGAEGGSLEFYKTEVDGETLFSSERNRDFNTARELFEAYSQSEDPLLWYYPVEISDEIISDLLPVLTREYREHEEDYFMNLHAWEEKLKLTFSELKPEGHQTFVITPVQKIEKHNYDSIGENPQYLDSVTTIYTNIPKHRKKLTGIGSVEGNTFVIRDENSVIKGVFPLERYEVEIETGK